MNFLLLLLLFLYLPLTAKVRLFSFQYNRPDFLEFQWRLLEKFLLDDYELIVLNDATDPNLEIAIETICKKNQIRHIRFEPEWHTIDPFNQYLCDTLKEAHISYRSIFNLSEEEASAEKISQYPGIRHNHVIQYALDHFGYDHDDIVTLLDHDLFPTRPFSVRALLENTPLIGIERTAAPDIAYIWVPFAAFDPKRLPSVRDLKFRCDVIEGRYYDTGASSYHYLKNHPEVAYQLYPRSYDAEFYHTPTQELRSLGFSAAEIQLIKDLPWPGCIELYLDRQFVHYTGAYIDFDPAKQTAFINFLNQLIQ
jgi:glycosyltransferase involved in cell wall biosynthesis